MGKFEVKAAKNGLMFNLKAANGEVIATSQVYKSPRSIRKGILSFVANARDAEVEDQTKIGYEPVANPKFEIYEDKGGEYRFRLKARNGRIIGVGQGYKKLDSCKKGIESVQENADDAELVIKDVE